MTRQDLSSPTFIKCRPGKLLSYSVDASEASSMNGKSINVTNQCRARLLAWNTMACQNSVFLALYQSMLFMRAIPALIC